ncbi:hypothetical protein FD754_021365 [Muntiacus muntjak]|uniref:Uncharacterized protein n=1 Tax=Muntiacus muntjak TaxID=9888 RepID=A0A5N3V5Y4_MUNMU|nr:hypothetical protein FD754_021365 [Muntiacus muntjak]
MMEDLAASNIQLMEKNAALQSLIPELQKPQAVKEDEPLQETQRPPEPQYPDVKESQKPRESQDLQAWETSAVQEPQKSLELLAASGSLEPPTTQDPQAPPIIYKLLGAWKSQKPSEAKEPQKLPMAQEDHKPPEFKEAQKSSDTQNAPAGQEPQKLEPQHPPNAQELQEAPKCQDTSKYLEFFEFPAPQELQDPEDAQEFLGLLTPKEFLDSLTAAETTASEFPQSSNDRDTQKIPEFLVQLESSMRVIGCLYPTKTALVSFVGNYFLGKEENPLLEQFDSFIQVLQDTFDNPENMEDANHHIHNELSHTSPATNLSDLITQYISLEEKLSGKPDPSPQDASPSEERAGLKSLPAESQPVQASSSHHREDHVCLYSGHASHFTRDCPVKPHHAQQVGNIEAWW